MKENKIASKSRWNRDISILTCMLKLKKNSCLSCCHEWINSFYVFLGNIASIGFPLVNFLFFQIHLCFLLNLIKVFYIFVTTCAMRSPKVQKQFILQLLLTFMNILSWFRQAVSMILVWEYLVKCPHQSMVLVSARVDTEKEPLCLPKNAREMPHKNIMKLWYLVSDTIFNVSQKW